MATHSSGTGAAKPADPLVPVRLAVAAVVAGLAIGGFIFFGDALSFEALRDNRDALIAFRDANYLAAALAFMAVYAVVIALSLPGGAIMTMTGGFLFGVAAGVPMVVVAATLGATVIFLAAKWGLGDMLHRRLVAAGGDGLLARMERGMRANEFSYLLFVRLVPVIPFFVTNLAPAFLGVRLRTYVAATALGIIPGTAVYAWIGAGLGEVFARGETPDLSLILEPYVLGPILALSALAMLPILVGRLRRRRAG